MSPTPSLAQAVNTLVERPDAAELFDTLSIVVNLVTKARRPVALTGVASALTPLLDLAVSDAEAYERVVRLIDSKRAAAGLTPLRGQFAEGFDKVEYQRVFMNEKRYRLRRAAAIENMARPERDQMRGRARQDFCDRQAAKWKITLDTRIASARQAADGARLAQPHLDALRVQFWAEVDATLDDLESKARRPK